MIGLRRRGRRCFVSSHSAPAFVFRSKRADRIESVVWDRTGLVLVHRRFEGCKCVCPMSRTA
ncbi:IS66 family insertion sequence element accessory protein TnpB [Bradyrhizobium sp. USDA 3397]